MEENKKLCKKCNEPNYIKEKTRTCVKCVSKKNNEKLKERGYYKTYYNDNMEKIKETSKKSYDENPDDKKEKVKAVRISKMPIDYVLKAKGRPKKPVQEIDQEIL
jgi:hypothetical protein